MRDSEARYTNTTAKAHHNNITTKLQIHISVIVLLRSPQFDIIISSGDKNRGDILISPQLSTVLEHIWKTQIRTGSTQRSGARRVYLFIWRKDTMVKRLDRICLVFREYSSRADINLRTGGR